jgi:predicted transcriptional regulator
LPLTHTQLPVAQELVNNGLLMETAGGLLITARGENFINTHKDELDKAYDDTLRGQKLLIRARSWVSLMEKIDRQEELAPGERTARNLALMQRDGLIERVDNRYVLTPDGVTRWQEYSDILSEAGEKSRRRRKNKRSGADTVQYALKLDTIEPAVETVREPDDSDDLRAMRDDVITTIEEISGKPVAPHIRILRHLNKLLDRK